MSPRRALRRIANGPGKHAAGEIESANGLGPPLRTHGQCILIPCYFSILRFCPSFTVVPSSSFHAFRLSGDTLYRLAMLVRVSPLATL